MGFRLPWSFSFEIFLDALFSRSQSTGQGNFRVIIVVETRDVLFVGAGHGLLRLHHFNRVGDTRAKTVARLGQRRLRQVDVAARYLDLLGR